MNLIKWLGTILLVSANINRAFNFHIADMVCTLIGAGLWAYAGWHAKDKALLAVNAMSITLMMIGLYNAR